MEFPGSSVADFFKDALFADVPYSRYIKSLKAGDRGPLSPSQTILIADMAIRISASTPDVDSVGAAEDRRKWAEMALEAGDTPTLIKRTAGSEDYQEAAKASPQDYERLIESNIALVVPELFGLPLEGLRVLYSAETGTAAVVELGSNGVPVQNFGSFALGNRPVLIGGRPFFRQSEQVLDKVLEDLPKGERQVSEDALKSLLYTAQTIDSLKDLTKSKFDFGNSSEYFDFLIQTLQPVDEPEKLEVEDPAENVEDDIPIMSAEDVLEFVPRKWKDAARDSRMSNWNLDRSLSVSSILSILTIIVVGLWHEAGQDEEIALLRNDLTHQDTTIEEVKDLVKEVQGDVKSLLMIGVPSSGESN